MFGALHYFIGCTAAVALLGVCSPVLADTRRQPATLDLSTALNQLARSLNLELIFDPAQVAGTQVHMPSSTSAKTALAMLLVNTRFNYRQADARTYVIVNRAIKVIDPVEQPAPSAGPEIVVSGHNSQNIDLVRGKDEIQPYWISSANEIASSGASTLDDYLREQLSMNRDVAPLSQSTSSPRSQVNLRGYGVDQTLVLVDGRRFASIPSQYGLFEQSDVNAIPVEAVERIEVLATSAGGIFGIGATGGVVNIILKRQYHGAMLSADSGTTTEGGGVHHRIFGQVGWTSPSGRTSLMVAGSYTHDGGLLVGDRPFETEMRAARVGAVGYSDTVVSNSLNIRSLTGAPLTLTAAYGGGAIGAASTFMPITAAGLDATALAALRTNAGKQDLSLAQDGQGALASLVARTSSSSVMATVRQDIGSGTELFVDYLRLENRGYQQVASYSETGVAIAPGASGNPFNQYITVSFPTTAAPVILPERDVEQRISGGLVQRFGRGWSLEADVAYSTTSIYDASANDFTTTAPNVFSGPAVIAAALASPSLIATSSSSINRLIDTNFRLTGPVASLPGGAATVTTTGEFRRESGAGFTTAVQESVPGTDYTSSDTSVPNSETVWSAFGEAHLPILPVAGPARPWRGLAAQVALRLDHFSIDVPPSLLNAIHNRGSVLATTFGLQSRPLSGLMIRGSMSTAAVPPAPIDMQSFTTSFNLTGYVDPERGGLQSRAASYPFQLTEGNVALKPERTQSLSTGVVIEPDRAPGLRLAVDYTRLTTHDVVETYADNDIQYFLTNEDAFPGRVVRAPLTAADQALGYTGGKVTAINDGPLQNGYSTLQALDLALSYDTSAGAGKLHMQADGDWDIAYRRSDDPRAGSYNLVGFADGPLAWRANIGLEWATDHWSIASHTQAYASYSLANGTPLASYQLLSLSLPLAQIQALQAREPRIPVQSYTDLSVAFWPKGRKGMQIRATMANVFNKKPPIAANLIPTADAGFVDVTPVSGVANYGDVLGRRIAVNFRLPIGQ